MKSYVIDASFILRGLLEHDSAVYSKLKKLLVLAQKKKVKLYAVEFFPFEIANGLRYSKQSLDFVVETLDAILFLPIEYFSLAHTHLIETVSLSYKLNTSVYDTSYHFLAKVVNGVFLTCDKEYYKKAKELGDIELVE